MTKPKLKVEAMAEEIGPVAVFARRAPAAEPALEPVELPSPTPTPDKQADIEANMSASDTASTLASSSEEMVTAIRRVIRHSGKEVVYVRLTPEEKKKLARITFNYKERGQKTSDTEIGRIAVNYIINDYEQNAEQSLLAKVLDSLLA